MFHNMENTSSERSAYQPVRFAYNTFESVNGSDSNLAPVILMHGFTDIKDNWVNIPQEVANGTMRRTYAYDARNHGDSEYSDVFSFDLNADDLFHFMDTLNIPKAVLVGHSMGGITSIKAALKKPGRVEMVFIEDMYVKKCTKEIADIVAFFYHIKLKAVTEIPKELEYTEAVKYAGNCFYKNVSDAENLFTQEEWTSILKKTIKRNDNGEWDVKFNEKVLSRFINEYETVTAEPSGEFNEPAYFLYGSLSPFQVGNEEDHIKKHFPNAELIKFEGVSHEIHFQDREKYIATILQCLKH